MANELDKVLNNLGIRDLAVSIADTKRSEGKQENQELVGVVRSHLQTQAENQRSIQAGAEIQKKSKSAVEKRKTAMQKKKEDRMEGKTPSPSGKPAETPSLTEEFRQYAATIGEKKEAERQLENLGNQDFDWTDASARAKHEADRKELERVIAASNAEIADHTAAKDREIIASMSDDERKMLSRYAESQQPSYNPITILFNAARNDYADLIEKYGEERLRELAETYERDQNAEFNQKVAETGAKAADEHPVLSSLASVPASAVGGIFGTLGHLKSAVSRTGRYPTLDPYAPETALQTYSSAVRSGVTNAISGDVYDEYGNLTEDGGFARQMLSYLYQGGMSVADVGARLVSGGGALGGATIAAANTFSQTLSEASAKGATPEQALLLATSSAAIEAATEKIPLDNLVSAAQGKNAVSVIKNALRQAGIEITEEEASLVGTLLAEAAILGDKSDFNQTVAALTQNGLSEEEAKQQAWGNILDEAVETMIVSGISGGVSGLGASLKGQYADSGEDYSKGIPATPEPLEAQPWDSLQQTSPEAQAAADAQIKSGDLMGIANKGQENQQRTIDEILDGVIPQNQEPVQTEAPSKADEVVNKTLEDIGLKQPETETVEDASTTISTDPDSHTAKEQEVIDAYQNSVDVNLVEYIEAVQNNQGGKLPKYPLNNVSDRAARDIMQLTGVDVSGNKVQIEPRIIEHILKDHGENGITDHSMRDVNDIARIQFIIDNYDSIEHGGKSAAYVYQNKNGRNAQAQTVIMKKKVNGTYFVVEAVPDTKKKTVYVTSAYMSKDGTQKVAGSLSGDANAPRVTSQNATKNPATSTDSILSSEQKINGDFADFESSHPSTPQVDTQRTSTEGGQTVSGDADTSTLGKQSAPSGDYRDSNSFTNSGLKSADEDVRNAYQDTMQRNPSAAKSEVKHNDDVDAVARERTSTPEKVWAEANYLIQKTGNGMAWDAEDVPTASRAIAELFRDGSAEAIAKRTELQEAFKKNDTKVGQVVQAHKIIGTMKDIESPMTAADTFAERMYDMKEKDTIYNPKKYGSKDFETWRKEVVTNVSKIAADIDKVPDGDTAAMKAIIEDIAYQRGISAKNGEYGLNRRAKKLLSKVSFDDLKTLANASIASMSDDFRKRGAAELAESTRKSAMLTSLTTFERNISGNTAIGLLDSASDSTTARIADGILSKFTNKQTVGNDIKNIQQYVQGAKDAATWASLCVELNVPVETDAMSTLKTATNGGEGGKYVGKTFNPNGNVFMRGLYGYQKFQSYELDVSDKIFEGGTKSAVSESLKNLKGLSADEQQRLADYTANRRTLKDATWTDDGGDTHGAVASRAGQFVKNGAINLGEKVGEKVGGFFGEKGKEVGGNVGKAVTSAAANKLAPFVSVPTNLAQTGVDYSVGIVKGAAEMAAIIHDAKNGIDIPVERQRQAASDFGRGVSGLGLIGIAAAATKAGIIAAHNDDDYGKKSLEQSEGLSGAQINLSALGRLGEDGGEKWRSGDILTSLDFLEPFNTHLYLGAELAQYDDMWETIKNYPGSVYNAALQAFMDSPMVSGLQELSDDVDELMDGSKSVGDFAAENLGEYAASFEPNIVRQAAQVIDGYYRDTRGDTPAETAFNQLIAGIPFLSKTLPQKVDGLGNEQERPGWLTTFFDPAKTTTYNENDVTTYLGGLSESTGDTSFYPDRQSPKAIKIGGEEIILSGSQRELYQKAYGDSVNEMYSTLMYTQGFQSLPSDVQVDALNKAKSYAAEIAKASVADNPDAPEETAKELAQGIYRDTVKNNISNAFKAISDDAKYGRDNSDSVAALEQAYRNVSVLPDDMKKEILEDSGGLVGYYAAAKEAGVPTKTFLDIYGQYQDIGADENLSTSEKAQDWAVALDKAERNGTLTSTQKKALKEKMTFRYSMTAETVKYDEMRESGISIEHADQIIDVLDNVAGTGKVSKETGKASVRDIDKYTAIVNVANLSDDEIDAIIKVYMPEYDPEADSPIKTYLKYEYARQQLDLSPDDFIDIYNVQLDGGKKAEKIASWVDLGYDYSEAITLYKLFAATGKTKIDVESWYADQVGQRDSNTTNQKTYTLPQEYMDDFGKQAFEMLYGTTP